MWVQSGDDSFFYNVAHVSRPQPEPPKRAEPVDVRAGGEPQELINGEREEQQAPPAEGNVPFPT